MGLLWALFENQDTPSAMLRIVLLGGFMGAFTTFSAYTGLFGPTKRRA